MGISRKIDEDWASRETVFPKVEAKAEAKDEEEGKDEEYVYDDSEDDKDDDGALKPRVRHPNRRNR